MVGPNLNTNFSIFLIVHRTTNKEKKGNEALSHSIKTNESPKKIILNCIKNPG
jgi:hypothetical protein